MFNVRSCYHDVKPSIQQALSRFEPPLFAAHHSFHLESRNSRCSRRRAFVKMKKEGQTGSREEARALMLSTCLSHNYRQLASALTSQLNDDVPMYQPSDIRLLQSTSSHQSSGCAPSIVNPWPNMWCIRYLGSCINSHLLCNSHQQVALQLSHTSASLPFFPEIKT